MRPIILFDGVCNLCNSAVDFVLKRDPRAELLFASNQSDAGRQLMERHGISADDVGRSIYLIEDGRAHAKSTAALRIARRLRLPWSLSYAFIAVPRPVRDWVYGIVSRNRYRWFGKRDTCRLPTPAERARFLEQDDELRRALQPA